MKLFLSTLSPKDERVLITCDKDNQASAAVARKNGGVFADEIIEEDGNILQRYWITLTIN